MSRLRGPRPAHGWHLGGLPGFRTVLLYFPDVRMTIAVLTNSEGSGVDPNALTNEVAELYLGETMQ